MLTPSGSQSSHVRCLAVEGRCALEGGAEPEECRFVERLPDHLHADRQPVPVEAARNVQRRQSRERRDPRELHDGRQHVLRCARLDLYECLADARRGEGQGRAEEDVGDLECVEEVRTQDRAVALGLQVVGG